MQKFCGTFAHCIFPSTGDQAKEDRGHVAIHGASVTRLLVTAKVVCPSAGSVQTKSNMRGTFDNTIKYKLKSQLIKNSKGANLDVS